MGIVVSSWRTSNISWHGVTRLNAICVLISSLQHLWPRENAGVRWFSFSLSLALFPGCACLLICCIIPLPVFSHASFCVLFCFACVARFPGRIPPVAGAACITFVPLPVILCHARDTSAVTHLGQLPVPPPISVRAPWDSGVRHASLLSRVSGNNGTNETCHFSPHIFSFFPSPFSELRSAEHPDCLFGSGIIFHVHDT